MELDLFQRGDDVHLSWLVAPPAGEGKPAAAVRFLVLRAPAAAGGDEEEADAVAVRESLERIAQVEVPSGSGGAGTFRFVDRGAAAVGDLLLYSVTAVTSHKGREVQGPLLRLRPIPPPGTPEDLAAEVVPEGVRLSWRPAGEDGTSVRVYRGPPDEEAPPRYMAQAEATGAYQDGASVLGKTYDYRVAATRLLGPEDAALWALGMPEEGREWAPWVPAELVVESLLAGPVRATLLDLYPPPVPENLRAFPEYGLVVLLWNPVEAPDLAGYVVYRAPEGGKPARLTDPPLTDTVLRDATVEPGETYIYTVTSVDVREPANESEPSGPARAAVPGRGDAP